MSAPSRTAQVDHYRYAVQWSAADEEFVATVAEFPSLSWLAPEQVEAIRGLEVLVQRVIEDMVASGELVPEPLSDRTYSGRLNLRVPEGLHRKLALEAVQRQTSLNAYVTQLLDRQESA
ncbi:MAG TPA: toxin-antitoxin system HicB family antitoxin [Lacisediminihabitans sp.]|uniref:type II toxin-antitoxin system HicB family antitoxin n=1 Tax=Lacisediminihabitans sp. TaxID=2787631 RepID=UPI002ED836C6